MDKLALLSTQYVCSVEGIHIPWNKIAKVIKAGITGGALVQHLAKLRFRMQRAKLPVPPPLRKGAILSKSATTRSAMKKAGGVSKKSKDKKKPNPVLSDSEDDVSLSDSEEEDQQPEPKRSTKKGSTTAKRKVYYRNEEPTSSNKKTKTQVDSESDSEDDTDESDMDDSLAADGPFVAAGASFLELVDDSPQTTVSKKLIVSFPIAGPFDDKSHSKATLEERDDYSDEEMIDDRQHNQYHQLPCDTFGTTCNHVSAVKDAYSNTTWIQPYSANHTMHDHDPLFYYHNHHPILNASQSSLQIDNHHRDIQSAQNRYPMLSARIQAGTLRTDLQPQPARQDRYSAFTESAVDETLLTAEETAFLLDSENQPAGEFLGDWRVDETMNDSDFLCDEHLCPEQKMNFNL
ncbi:hypothetical protein MMC21_003962 [Puttea exsequens]|nr:hypothetical protein [Puttea exsequens]